MPIVNFDGHQVYSTGKYNIDAVNEVFAELVYSDPNRKQNTIVQPHDPMVHYEVEWYEQDNKDNTVLLFICISSLSSNINLTRGGFDEFNFAMSEQAYISGKGGSLDQFIEGLVLADSRIKPSTLQSSVPSSTSTIGLRHRRPGLA